jgi:hypothetical protein
VRDKSIRRGHINRLGQLGDTAWMYIVVLCRANPELFRIQNPAKRLTFELKTKGVQYFPALEEWTSKV